MRVSAALSLSMILGAACAEGTDSAHWGGTIDTLENGAVLVSNPADGIWTDQTAWRLVEEVRIGSVEGAGPETFAQIVDLEVDAAGRIYVLDRQAQDVRVFDQAGAHVRTIGRRGGGPGEFRLAHGLAMDHAGRLWVVDRNRFTVFDTSGTFLQTYRREVTLWGFRWYGAFLANGALYDLTMAGTTSGGTTALVRYDSILGMVDTLSLPSYDRPVPVWEFSSGTGRITRLVPFAPGISWTLDPRGYVWAGITDQYRLHQITLTGDTIRIVQREHTPVRVTPEERDSLVETLRERVNAPIDVSKIPAQKPAFSQILVEESGHLWVTPSAPSDTPGTRFDVFDPEGRFLGSLSVDLRVSQLWIRGNKVYGVHRDELDVPFVVRLGIGGR
jgi:hypothetical protein